MTTGPQAFRWRLAGETLPPLTAALHLGEAARAAVFRGAEQRGLMPLPDGFHRSDDHDHAFWLAEDADDDGFIDHILVFAACGLPEPLIPVLAEGGRIFLGGQGAWRLAPDWMGQRAPGALFGPARLWISATPFVTPRWQSRGKGEPPRSRDLPRNQLLQDIGRRGLPEPVWLGEDQAILRRTAPPIPAERFVTRFRGDKANSRRPADATPRAVALQFAEPVWGPLAFGFGAHFGLGLMEPADDWAPMT
jgi:CRISPR-associated protein Csb2